MPSQSQSQILRIFKCPSIAAGMLLLSALAMVWSAYPVQAHDAPMGWSYGATCCSNRDCGPLPDGAVTPVTGGWLINESGEVVPYGSKKERQSLDGDFHLCRRPGPNNDGLNAQGDINPVICLYVPGFGS